MKTLLQSAMLVLLFGLVALPSQAAFKSLYVFGDALSSTTDNPDVGPLYYGQRYSNGRVWVEVLAQRQGLVYDPAKNDSYWDHNSSNLLAQVQSFTPPADVANDLFVVWVCNADTYDAATLLLYDPNYSFINANIQSQANHLQIIRDLYAKGVRTLIMPNAVDLSEIPAFDAGTAAAAIHAGCVDYDARFAQTIAQARALCPGLKIYAPDFYSLLNNVLTNAAYYGLTNAVSTRGYSIDALDAQNYGYGTASLDGYGTNYIFWDLQDPTAKFHEIIADTVQQLISPVRISRITTLGGSNRLDVVNVPLGLNGFVEGSTNILQANWTALQDATGTSPTQSFFVPLPAPINSARSFEPAYGTPILPPGGTPVLTALQFYRVKFPFAWTWP